jgi:TonB family protein
MKNYGFQTLTLFAVIGLFSVLAVNGQTCNLNLSVYSFENRTKEEMVTEATISLKREKSRKKIPAAAKGQVGYFENLTPGKYWASVSKKGFKTTTKWLSLDCEFASNGAVNEVVFLWKGASNETEEMSSDALSPAEANSMASRAERLPAPAYPEAARAVRAGGPVGVQVLIDELGRVVFAKAVSGNPLLRASAVNAARAARFKPVTIQGMPVKISGIIAYNFVP